jgi:hypothetical protein
MRTFAQKPKATQQTTSSKSTKPGRALLGQSRDVQSILHLQRTIGNQGVLRLLQTETENINTTSASSTSTGFTHDFSRIPVYPSTRNSIQPKLKVNAPGDRYEQEADWIADEVLRQKVPNEEDEKVGIQARASQQAAGGEREVDEGIEMRLSRSKGGGNPISDEVRAFVEPRMRFDFSNVRVHSDNEADWMNQEFGSQAFAHGQHLYFGAGLYDPQSNEGRRLLVHELTHVVQQGGDSARRMVQRDNGTVTEGEERHALGQEEEGLTLSEMLAQAVMTSPRLMASQAEEYVNDITEIFSGMEPGDLFFDRIHEVYWGFGALILALRRMPEGEKTTQEQRQQANDLARKWFDIQDDIEAHNEREARRNLEEARQAAEQLRLELLYAYRDIYTAGQDPEDVEVGSGNMKMLAEKTKDLLKAINEADASLSGRSVTPLIPVLDNTLSVVNLISGWKVTSGLASESESAIADLQNAWSLSTTALGLAGCGKVLPLFSHIGPLLDGIAKGWSRVVSQLQKKNRLWWEARDVMGEELPHPAAMPGGQAVFTYMKRVFRASEPLPGRPSDAVVDFFDDNRKMFSKAATEVMGKSWAEVPTESSWLFWTTVDPDKLNRWVYYNRDMVWRLIYGRGMKPPG